MTKNGKRSPSRLATLLAERLPVDLGSSCLTGLQARAVPEASPRLVAHPIYETLALDRAQCAALGSDCQRVGALFERPKPDAEQVTRDDYGVDWLWTDGYPAQLNHPLESADWSQLSRHPRPASPPAYQLAEDGAGLIVADAPCPGLLDTCFALRGGWQFLDDLTGNWRIANALLDWALETIGQRYDALISALPAPPDIVLYCDDIGFQGGMYLSDTDFRFFLHPRLKTLLSRLRRQGDFAILLHSCGGVRSILQDFADLGVEMLNLDFYAKGMEIGSVRKALPSSMILHGPVDIGALGAAALHGERGAVARYALDLAEAGPCFAAPPDSIGESQVLSCCVAGAAAVRALDPDDLKALRNIGPKRSIVERIIDAAAGTSVPALACSAPSPAAERRAASIPDREAGKRQSPSAGGA